MHVWSHCVHEDSVLPTQFCFEPKTALKNKAFKNNKASESYYERGILRRVVV